MSTKPRVLIVSLLVAAVCLSVFGCASSAPEPPATAEQPLPTPAPTPAPPPALAEQPLPPVAEQVHELISEALQKIKEATAESTYAEDFCADKRNIGAHVIAFDQPIALNRSGATIPSGAIYALANDVVPVNPPGGVPEVTCYSDPNLCQPGKVTLRSHGHDEYGNYKPGKRPRPIVLRANEGDCLHIRFTNLLSESTSIPAGQPQTRAASLHVQGQNWVRGPEDDGSWVGGNCNSQVGPTGANPPDNCATAVGNTATYTLFAEHEGPYMLYSTGDDYSKVGAGGDGGFLQFGLWGTLNVQPSGYEEAKEYFKKRSIEPVALWQAEWYRSQVTEQDLCLASKGHTWANGVCAWQDETRLPVIDYGAIYPDDHPRAGLPILNMLCPPGAPGCSAGDIVHSDLTAIITGPGTGRFPEGGRFPDLPPAEQPPSLRPVYSYPQRLQPYREFSISYHESYQVQQAFNSNPTYFKTLSALTAAQDNFGINYGMGGLASPVLANRLGVGPSPECVECKYEEFFLTSWALGDPAMVVDVPATECVMPDGKPKPDCQATVAYFPDDPSNVYHSYMSDHLKFRISHAGPDLHHLHHQHAHQWLGTPNSPNADYLDSQSIGPGSSFTLEMVYEGSGNLNQTVGDSIFHCHFYPHFASGMWSLWRVHDVFERGSRLDRYGRPSTECVPSGYDGEPDEDRGECEPGYQMATVTRALPDGEIDAGTPSPALVPMPTLPMAPVPAPVRLVEQGKIVEVNVDGTWLRAQEPIDESWSQVKARFGTSVNPGYPYYIPGIAGRRPPHPPMDIAWVFSGCNQEEYNGSVCTPTQFVPEGHQLLTLRKAPAGPRQDPKLAGCVCDTPLDGGLPRHVMVGRGDAEYLLKEDPGLTDANTLPFAQTDFGKELHRAPALELPESGTLVEKVAMAAHSERLHFDSQLPDGTQCGICSDNAAPCWAGAGGTQQCRNPFTATCNDLGAATCGKEGHVNFVLNGLDPVPGAPYADPCIQYDRLGGPAEKGVEGQVRGTNRQYLAADIQLDAIFNKEGWHFPQQRMISLWGDVESFIKKQKAPQPLFMRVNSYDCMNYTLANLVPNVYELDDFQVRTPTDILGQHIHLVKFDVTSSDGAANGWNYEDGTFAPNEVTERIRAINAAGGLQPAGGGAPVPLTPEWIKFFGPGPGGEKYPEAGAWVGAQATVQRWYDDPLFNNMGICDTDLSRPCTLAQNSWNSPVTCPANGLCVASAGFCSDNGAECTERDLSRCDNPLQAACNPRHDRTIRTVFTHDHFGPSTHQQSGLYAGVVAEPKDSQWLDNQTGKAFGGFDAGLCGPGDPFPACAVIPGRTVHQNGVWIEDSGPTSWEAVIKPPDPYDSYREFLFQAQDTTLMYDKFYTPAFYPGVNFPGQFAFGDLGVCKTVKDEPCGFCSYTGRCGKDASKKCMINPPGGSTVPNVCGQGDSCAFTLAAGGIGSTLTACTTTHTENCASESVPELSAFKGVESCNYVAGVPHSSWGVPGLGTAGQVINATKGAPEGITFASATDNFSYNYRNEPLFPRIDGADGKLLGGRAGDLSWVYSSAVRRPSPRGKVCWSDFTKACAGDADCGGQPGHCQPVGFCSDNYAMCTEGGGGVPSNVNLCKSPAATCRAIVTPNQDPVPYFNAPLTPGVQPGDPFTPLVRTYAGDDVQLRVLIGAHINPHNLTVHGMNWLKEPSFVDSGWRNSEVMGISEHFELITQVDPPFEPTGDYQPQAPYDKPWVDYLFQPGMAAIEQASGNWGLVRAYQELQPDLAPLPQNESLPGPVPVCPSPLEPPAVERVYHVVALSAQQALGGSLVYNKSAGLDDQDAILFFRMDDPKLHCTEGGEGQPWTCSQPYGGQPEPLVLRAAAGDCVRVMLHNGIDVSKLPGAANNQLAGVASNQLPTGCSTKAKPNNNCTWPSNVSMEVGLRPQLVAYDARTSDGTNAGFNPPQTVKVGGHHWYTWYAGHLDAEQGHIPIEFGAANLLPSDPLNHYRHGLFGGLIIEPPGATWTNAQGVACGPMPNASCGVEAVVSYEDPHDGRPRTFREFVVFTQDDLQNLSAPAGQPKPVNAVNYRSPYLGNGSSAPAVRYCSETDCTGGATPTDVSCSVSDQAWCKASDGSCALCDPPPTFTACAGEEVRFRLLHPGGTNTNEVFELFGHTFSEAPYVTAEENCDPPTTHTNLLASQWIGNVNLCGSAGFWLDPAYYERLLFMEEMPEAEGVATRSLQELGAELEDEAERRIDEKKQDYVDMTTGGLWEAPLHEWKAAQMGHGPGNHFDVVIESAGGANSVPGDYLWRSFPVMHFNRGIWGYFRVVEPGQSEDLSCHVPRRYARTSVPAEESALPAGAGR